MKRAAQISRVVFVLVLLAGIGFGMTVGVGGYTFIYARGYSYLGSDPTACMNCHIMKEQFDGWTKASHRNVATCNDCHAPHNLVGKYATKAVNGFNHSLAFTTGNFPEPIRITKFNLEITENACRHCHAEIVEAIEPHVPKGVEWQSLLCTQCHPSVGHLHMD